MFKFCDEMMEFTGNLDTVLDYYLDQNLDESWPEDVVLALCGLAWPNRVFTLAPDEDRHCDEGMCVLREVIDQDTGETAAELYKDAVAQTNPYLTRAGRRELRAAGVIKD